MPIVNVLPQGLETEADDAPMKFRNIDTEVFVDSWDKIEYVVQPGEVVTKPKYLVNHMAWHLSKKMYKREAYAAFQGTEFDKQRAAVQVINPKAQWTLMKKMVADNFPEEKIAEPVMPTASTVVDKTQVEVQQKVETKPASLKCEKCEFTAKSKAGLLAHGRRKHK